MRSWLGLLLRRPVGVAAGALLVTALAVISLVRLPVALLPPLQHPSLLVWTAYPDVPPVQVERAVTEPVEEALAATTGLLRLTSRSQLGGSLVRLELEWGEDLDFAALEVREKLARLAGRLPDAAERPLVLRLDPSQRPLLIVALTEAQAGIPNAPDTQDTPEDDERALQLEQVARELVARRLEQLEGIARVRVTGGRKPEIHVDVEPAVLAAYSLDLDDITAALARTNVNLSGGLVRRGPFLYSVEVSGEFRDLEDIRDTLISTPGQPPVRLGDLAEVRSGIERRRGLVRLDGEDVLLLLVEGRPGSNAVQAAADARERLDELRRDLPGLRFDVVTDDSRFVRQALAGAGQALLGGGVLAVLVLLLFLRRLRVLLAVAAAIPLSLGLALTFFDLLGISLNLTSLAGLALGIGLLVDNSIVVVENVSRLRERGAGAFEAARNGTAEVAGAITASTLTTLAIFVPLTFVEGLAAQLFRDYALAIAGSVLASLLSAVTIVPLIASREASRESGQGTSTQPAPGFRLYETCLGWTLRHRAVTLALTILLLVACALLAWHLPQQLVPRVSEPQLEITLTAPAEADIHHLATAAAKLEQRLLRQPGVERVLADLGERDDARLDIDPRPQYRGELLVLLAPEVDPAALAAEIERWPVSAEVLSAGVEVSVRGVRNQLERLLLPYEADLLIDLGGPRREALEPAAIEALMRLAQRPELRAVHRVEHERVPTFQLTYDRDALSRFELDEGLLQTYLESAVRGRESTRLRGVQEDIPILLRSTDADSLEQLLALRIPAAGTWMPLSTFVDAELVELPAVLLRDQRTPVLRLAADLAPGTGLDAATSAILDLQQWLPGDELQLQVSGANRAFQSSLQDLRLTLLLSLTLVYLVLAAQFESLIQPLLILAVVPLAFAGVALTLWLCGGSWNLMSLTGTVVLIGIAVNDAILKVDFINRRRQEGATALDAVRDAGRDRFRPMVMTTVTTVFGLLPLALGVGAGGALQAPLAQAIAGGLCAATPLTLLVLPALYLLLPHRTSTLPTAEPQTETQDTASRIDIKTPRQE